MQDAVAAKEGAEAAKQSAETAQQAAAENQKNAETQAANAKASADTAAEQADFAKESATGAANSASAAQESETNAGLSATAASNAEAAAKQAQNSAETAKTDAETAKTAAGGSADAALAAAADAKKTLESIPDDYSTLSGKVDENVNGIRELKEDLIDISKVQKILLIDDKSLFSFNGYLNKNGNYQNDSSFVTTDYISIEDNTSIQMKVTTMENLSNAVFFDSEKNVVGKYTGSGNAATNSISVDIPPKAKFVRFSLLKSDTVHILMICEQIPHRTLWLAIGDSITYGYGNEGVSYADYAAKKLNITLNKQGVSGSTLSGMYKRVKDGDFDGIKPDIITICGGTNDWNIGKKSKNMDSDTVYTADTYMSYVNCIIETLRAKQPQATIIFLTCLQRDYFGTDTSNVTGTTNSNGETLADYENVVLTSCKNHAVPVIDLYAQSGINAQNYLPLESGYSNASIKWLTTDGLHPNDDGHRLLGTFVANCLKNFI